MAHHACCKTAQAVACKNAPAHLAKLKEQHLVKVLAQGCYRYYSLGDRRIAKTLEALTVLGGIKTKPFSPTTPLRLRLAHTCYDHMAGTPPVALHDKLFEAGWRRLHLGEADELEATLRLNWVSKYLEGRGLHVTPRSREALARHFDIPAKFGI